ncbi:hypothetical protein niasHS_010136 [Heterodera schachtii]|uniref:TIR domain-containing protein n=1 Tax=Heterodera schachtii TaxID=97005 RepID=A0ABD2J385_HETSC
MHLPRLLSFKRISKFDKSKLFTVALCLLAFVLAFPAGKIASGHIHRRRDTTPNGGATENDQPQHQQHQHQQYSVFRYRCPDDCSCMPDDVKHELLIVICAWPKLRSFGQFPRGGTKSLSIQCTGTKPNDAEEQSGDGEDEAPFDGFDELQELRITNCSSSPILLRWLLSPPRRLFLSTPRLRLLHLSQMPSLLRLSAHFFDGLHALERLTLTGTALAHFPLNALCPLRALQVLDVSSNSLSSPSLSLSPSQCQLGQLIIADLSSNRIGQLRQSDLSPFPALRKLALANNTLAQIDSAAFGHVPFLQQLDLSRNRLSSLPRLPPNISHLFLSDNLFTKIPASVSELNELKELSMSANAIGGGAKDNAKGGETADAELPLRSASLEKLDLSSNALRRVPTELVAHSLHSLKILNLAANSIERMEPKLMANFSALKQLDLSQNFLRFLPFGTFDGLDELQMLLLDHNKIEKMDEELFSGGSAKVHTLAMSNNALTEMPVAVRRLQKIKRMDFSNNRISHLYKFVLNKLAHLSKLNLAGNSLESVESFVFSDCANLAEISLAKNRIQTISSDAFAKCPRLRKIDLSGNKIQSLNKALLGLASLQWVNVSENAVEELEWAQFPAEAELLEIEANGNEMRSIGTEDEARRGRKLRKLELRRNHLANLAMDSLPPSLEELDVRENRLTQVTFGTAYELADTAMAQLKKVDLRSNKLSTIPRELYERFVVANAPFGELWVGDNPLECSCEMNWLLNASASAVGTAISRKQINAAKGGVMDIESAKCVVPLDGQRKRIIETTPFDFLCPYSLFCAVGCQCCQFNGCDCKSRCPPGCHCFRDRSSATNVVKCSGDSVGSDFSVRSLPMHASHVFLSGLNLPVLSSSEFFGRKRLRELHLNRSDIRRIEPNAFESLANLMSLHLSNNRLTHFNGSECTETKSIRLLDLSGNELTEMGTELGEVLPNLETLLLADNAMEEVPEYLQSPSSANLRRVSLSGNPFRCDCAEPSATERRNRRPMDAAHWLEGNRGRVTDAPGMRCVENVTRAKERNESTVLAKVFALPNHADDHLFSMPMLEFLREENSGIFLLCCLIFVLFCRREKNKNKRCHFGADSVTTTQTTCLISANNSDSLASSHSPPTSGGSSPMPIAPQQMLVPEHAEKVPLISYDIFISYHKRDERLLEREFCRPLMEMGFSLCLLHKCGYYKTDGHQLQGNNAELDFLVQHSRALLIFMTPEFLWDEWNTLQVSISHKLAKHKLIVYVSKQLQNQMDKLPEELGHMMRLNVQLWSLWDAQSFRDRFFWDGLMGQLNALLKGIYQVTEEENANRTTAQQQPIYAECNYETIQPQVPSEML